MAWGMARSGETWPWRSRTAARGGLPPARPEATARRAMPFAVPGDQPGWASPTPGALHEPRWDRLISCPYKPLRPQTMRRAKGRPPTPHHRPPSGMSVKLVAVSSQLGRCALTAASGAGISFTKLGHGGQACFRAEQDRRRPRAWARAWAWLRAIVRAGDK